MSGTWIVRAWYPGLGMQTPARGLTHAEAVCTARTLICPQGRLVGTTPDSILLADTASSVTEWFKRPTK